MGLEPASVRGSVRPWIGSSTLSNMNTGISEISGLISMIFDWIFFILAGYKDMHKSLDEFEFDQLSQLSMELATLERLKNQCIMF